MSENYLVHHGIAGQKHGVRNGPPYPLDSKDHSAAEKKGDYRDKYYAIAEKKYNKNRKKLEKVENTYYHKNKRSDRTLNKMHKLQNKDFELHKNVSDHKWKQYSEDERKNIKKSLKEINKKSIKLEDYMDEHFTYSHKDSKEKWTDWETKYEKTYNKMKKEVDTYYNNFVKKYGEANWDFIDDERYKVK